MPRVFVSDKDRRSFLAPAYQFTSRRSAEAFAAEQGLDRSDDAFKLFSVGNTTFQPRAFTDFETGVLTDDRSARDASRPRFLTVRRTGNPQPRDARNACLLVEGPRLFHRYIHRTNKLAPAYYRFASGDFPCYAVWGRDGRSLGGSLFEEEGGQRVYVGRSARGVLYASTPRFKPDLSIEGYDMRVALVEFRVLDSRPEMDGVIQATVQAFRSHGYDPQEPCQAYGLNAERFDPFWRELERLAFEGFKERCERMPKALETELARYLDQSRKAQADLKAGYGMSYRDRIKGMDWEAALRSVEEPWQLEVVIHEIDGEPFYDSPNYSGALYNRVANMLKRHACSDERRAQLSRMIREFVEPRSGLWNYCGD